MKNKWVLILAVAIVVILITVGWVFVQQINKNMEGAANLAQSNLNNNQAPDVTPMDEISTDNSIVINDMTFNPQIIFIKTGTVLKWENHDTVAHSIVSDTDSIQVLNSPEIANGETFSFNFDKSGDYKYHCSIHPDMIGEVVVSD